MNINFEELLSQVTEFIQSETKTDTIIGKQFSLGEFTCVPIIRARMGFGTGGGEGKGPGNEGQGEGAAIGAGVSIEPIGFLVSRADDIHFLGATKHSGMDTALEKLPDLLEKMIENRRTPESLAEARLV
ncbi:MAG: GerW family sporulation protein [Bacteroidota bacterium]